MTLATCLRLTDGQRLGLAICIDKTVQNSLRLASDQDFKLIKASSKWGGVSLGISETKHTARSKITQHEVAGRCGGGALPTHRPVHLIVIAAFLVRCHSVSFFSCCSWFSGSSFVCSVGCGGCHKIRSGSPLSVIYASRSRCLNHRKREVSQQFRRPMMGRVWNIDPIGSLKSMGSN
jgi:hypothetical protein